jgi:CspA family cold shock protein
MGGGIKMNQVKKCEDLEEENVTRCRVKWFNLHLGYGFLEPEGGGKDIFMHFSVLEEAGYQHICQNDEILCTTGQGKNGTQVLKIHKVFSANGTPQNQSLVLEEKTGIVKWFNVTRGYGFIEPDDGGRDIFIHTAPLKRLGYDRLPKGKRVRVKVFSTENGSEVRDVLFLEKGGEEELCDEQVG